MVMVDRTTTEETGHYNGPAEVWVGEVKRFDVSVRLKGYVDVTMATSFGGTERVEGLRSWDGQFNGLAQGDMMDLAPANFELRLPDGRTGEAVLRRSGPHFTGTGRAPF
jgi:hypothetical protein